MVPERSVFARMRLAVGLISQDAEPTTNIPLAFLPSTYIPRLSVPFLFARYYVGRSIYLSLLCVVLEMHLA